MEFEINDVYGDLVMLQDDCGSGVLAMRTHQKIPYGGLKESYFEFNIKQAKAMRKALKKLIKEIEEGEE